MVREQSPLAMIHDAVLQFLEGRDDAVLFGAQAVNAYVGEVRATQEVDVYTTRAALLAEEICQRLHAQFHIALRIREVAGGEGFRIYQLRESGNRHLVDVRQTGELPPSRRIDRVLVVDPAELIAGKTLAYVARKGTPKAGTDWRDLASLLLTFPALKVLEGEVMARLTARGASEEVRQAWSELVSTTITAEDDDGY